MMKTRWDNQIDKVMAPIREAVPSQTLYIRTRQASAVDLAIGAVFDGTGWVDHAAVFIDAGKTSTPMRETSDATLGDELSTAFVAFELGITGQ